MKRNYSLLLIVIFLVLTNTVKTSAQIILLGEAEELNSDTDLFIFKKDGKYAVAMDSITAVFQFDSVVIKEHGSFSDFLYAKKNGKWGALLDPETTLLEYEYDDIIPTYLNKDLVVDVFAVEKNGKYGTVGRNKKTLLPIIYDNISPTVKYGTGHYIMMNNKVGWADIDGKVTIPCEYDSLCWYNELGLFKAKKGKYTGMVTKENKIQMPFNNDAIIIDVSSAYIDPEPSVLNIAIQRNGKWFYQDSAGKVLQNNVSADTIRFKYRNKISNADFKSTFARMVKDMYSNATQKFEMDTVHVKLIDWIIRQRENIRIELPDLHKESIDFIPDFIEEPSIFGLKQEFRRRGFLVTSNGFSGRGITAMDGEYTVTFTKDECNCQLGIAYYHLWRLHEYKVVESITCWTSL